MKIHLHEKGNPNSLWSDLFIVSTFFVSGLKYIDGLEKFLDIRLYDESNYLWGGVTLFNEISVVGTVAEKTQVYSFWYYVLSLFEPDRIALYYLNYKVLTVLLPVILYLVFRRYGINLLTATIISFSFLISNANLEVWPKVGHFATAVILTSFIFASYTNSHTMRLVIICLGALLSAYARPEFFVAFLLFSLLLVQAIFKNFKKESIWVLVLLVGIAVLTGFLIANTGLPVSGTRSFGAFGQHFSLNWIQWTNNHDLSNWTDWEIIVNRNFGDVHSIAEAFISNPHVFFRHVLSNFMRFPKSLLELFFLHTNLVLPSTFQNLEAVVLFGLFAIFVFLSFITKQHNSFKEHIKTKKSILVVLICYITVSMLSTLVIFPREHYLLLPGVLILVMLATFLAKGETMLGNSLHKMVVPLGIITIFITPSFTSFIGVPGEKVNVETILFIKSLEIEDEVNLLEANGGFHIYLGDNFHRVASYDKDSDFNEFLDKERINAIVLTNGLKNDSQFKGDPSWSFFLNNYQATGFVKFDVPNTEWQLIVEKGLIPE